jgi:cell division protein FtsB
MRIRRSVTRTFVALVFPTIAMSVGGYFAYYAICGDRGLLALEDVQARLGVHAQLLSQAQDDRLRLQHRIALMKPGAVDTDLVEELARSRMMEGAPGQVAVPRDGH